MADAISARYPANMLPPEPAPVCQRERRWLIVTADGRHVTFGRDTDPTEDEIRILGRQVDELDRAAWLVIQAGDYHDPEVDLELMAVRRVGCSEGSWEEARTAFLAIRERGIAPVQASTRTP